MTIDEEIILTISDLLQINYLANLEDGSEVTNQIFALSSGDGCSCYPICYCGSRFLDFPLEGLSC